MVETILQVSVIILIRLGMNDDGVIDPCLFCESDECFEGVGLGSVRCVNTVGKVDQISAEQMDVCLD